jgi:hypothetical protein
MRSLRTGLPLPDPEVPARKDSVALLTEHLYDCGIAKCFEVALEYGWRGLKRELESQGTDDAYTAISFHRFQADDSGAMDVVAFGSSTSSS